jgi:predicted dehydrogenase
MTLVAEKMVTPAVNLRKPRLGFVGVGWIGRNRLEAIVNSGAAEIAAVADPSPELVEQAIKIADTAERLRSLEEMLNVDLDGVVIATPSALHAEQSIAALKRGLAVFCQKPLARNAVETNDVIAAARHADCLLGVDLSYRYLSGVQKVRELLRNRELGKIYAVELAFHNAYGPDKAWFHDPKLSGGGCVIDLGIHLVDLVLWTLDFPEIENVTSSLFAKGERLRHPAVVEDYATARLDLGNGASVQLSCSWCLPAGCDAIISAAFYGTKGGAILRNVNGSFYDFTAERCNGTKREFLSVPPDAWGGRAVNEWAHKLAVGCKFDPEIEHLLEVSRTLDRIYGREK